MKKISLGKLELKIDKITNLETKKIKGGGKKKGPTSSCPYTDNYPSADTSVVVCVC